MEEVWKPIVDFEDLYLISNLGRVLSQERVHEDRTIKEKILKYRTNNKGYICIDLYNNGKTRKCLIHRLMAQAFIPNDDPKNKTEVNHKNGIRTHNVVDVNDLYGDGTNLEWSTPKANLDDRHKRQKDFKALRMAEKGISVEKELDKAENEAKKGGDGFFKMMNKKYTLLDLFK